MFAQSRAFEQADGRQGQHEHQQVAAVDELGAEQGEQVAAGIDRQEQSPVHNRCGDHHQRRIHAQRESLETTATPSRGQ